MKFLRNQVSSKIIDNSKIYIMETRARVKRVLEIPARRSQAIKTSEQNVSDKSFYLVINLWLFKFEYSKEQHPNLSWFLTSTHYKKTLEKESFLMVISIKCDALNFLCWKFNFYCHQLYSFGTDLHFHFCSNDGIFIQVRWLGYVWSFHFLIWLSFWPCISILVRMQCHWLVQSSGSDFCSPGRTKRRSKRVPCWRTGTFSIFCEKPLFMRVFKGWVKSEIWRFAAKTLKPPVNR